MTLTAQADDNPLPATQALIPTGLIGCETGDVGVNVTGFDYAMISADAAGLARQTVEKIRQRQQRVSREIIEIGADLLRVKDVLGHGHFSAWLEAEFDWTIRTAQNYMRAAEAFGLKSETVSLLPPSTLFLLAAMSTPQTIVGEVVAKLEHGDCVDPADVKARIEVARQQRHIERSANKRKMARDNAARWKAGQEQRQQEQEQRQAEEDAASKRVVALIRAKFDANELAALIEDLSKTMWGGAWAVRLRDGGEQS